MFISTIKDNDLQYLEGEVKEDYDIITSAKDNNSGQEIFNLMPVGRGNDDSDLNDPQSSIFSDLWRICDRGIQKSVLKNFSWKFLGNDGNDLCVSATLVRVIIGKKSANIQFFLIITTD